MIQAVRLFVLTAMLLAVACDRAGAVPVRRILCLGDSITAGVIRATHGSLGPARDSLGGWPGRLEQRLVDVRVINRGIGGATTSLWLLDSTAGPAAQLWRLHHTLWPDSGGDVITDGQGTFALAVLRADRPDLVVILLGANDLASPDAGQSLAERADETAARLDVLRRTALTVAPRVLVATVLPNRREPAELRERLNAQIRAAYADHLPFGERFAAGDWERLLGDEVHPNEQGYAVLAQIAADELAARGLVRVRTDP